MAGHRCVRRGVGGHHRLCGERAGATSFLWSSRSPAHKIKQFEKFGEIESVKAASDLFSPVSGEVLEANEELALKSELVNQSPHQLGWLLRVRLDDPAEAQQLLDYAAYQRYLQGLIEGHG